ncbi:MAG: D-alanyl-D-alanine carboxypeptidase family protein [Lachnospiraceae bacterium]|nr:D-alanyl-D-alanine carboxypeptidase family protein [Lachnospiraceae bacterium]
MNFPKFKKKFILVLLVFVFSNNLHVFSYAEETVEIHAEACILGEVSTGKIIYSKNADKKMYPASMTKILTALVSLDYYDYDSLITVGDEINSIPYDSSKAGHTRGETLSVLNLMRGLIIPSGNDTSAVIASAVAKKVSGNSSLNYTQDEQIFAKLMNEKAKALGATNSNFVNPHGYHDENHYSTANDIFKISQAFAKNSTLMEIAGETLYSGLGADESLTGESSLIIKNYYWETHNLLLSDGEYKYEYATGIKTGFTDEAGDCLVASAKKDGVELIAVIFNSEDPNRWIDAKTLFNYGFNNYEFKTVDSYGNTLDNVKLTNQEKDYPDNIDIEVRKKVLLFLSDEEFSKLERKMVYSSDYIYVPEEGEDLVKNDNTGKDVTLKAPIDKYNPVGTVQYVLNNNILHEEPVYAKQSVPEKVEKSIIDILKGFLKNIFTVKGFLMFIISLLALTVIFLIIASIIKRIIHNRRNRHKRLKYAYRIKKKR